MRKSLGRDLYDQLISANYRNWGSIFEQHTRLEEWAFHLSLRSCPCLMLGDPTQVSISNFDLFAKMEKVASRGEPYWWLELYRCPACGTWWLVGQEFILSENYVMQSLSAEEVEAFVTEQQWPQHFDSYETMVRIESEIFVNLGHNVDLPTGPAPDLKWLLRQIAEIRPGYQISKLAQLLVIDPYDAKIAARQVVNETGFSILFDEPSISQGQ